MAIDGAEITKAHFLEQNQAAAETAAAIGIDGGIGLPQADIGDGAFKTFLGFVRELEGEFALGQSAQEILEIFLQAQRTKDT